MKILIIGAGGVGLGLGAFLINAGVDVSFLATTETARQLESGFRVFGVFGDYSFEPSRYNVLESFESASEFDYVLITTKTTANNEIASKLCDVKSKLGNAKLTIVQNGWGNAEKFVGCFGKESIFAGRIITGFYRHKRNEIEITVHADSLMIGNIFVKELSGEITDLVDAFVEGGFDAKVSCDVDKHLWAKMLYNCALNPLGAILNVEYGRLAEIQHTREIMNRILEEVFKVMEACGFTTFWNNVDDYMEVFYSTLVPVTAEHRSSMLQDIKNGNKTEIDSLNGMVVNLAKRHDLSVPYNEFIIGLIKTIEEK